MKTSIAFSLAVLLTFPVMMRAQQRIATEATVTPGQGFDVVTGDVRGTCLNSGTPVPVDKDNVSLSIDYATSAESLYRSMEASAAGQWGSGLGSQVSISFGMSTSEFFSDKSAVLAIDEKLTTIASAFPPDPTVTSDKKNLSDDGFKAQCGSGFISEVINGGQFVALLRTEDKSKVDTNQFRADVQAAFGPDNGSASYREAYQRVISNTSFQLHLVRIGGQGDLPVLAIPQLIEYARTFPSLVRKSGNVAFIGIESYSAAGRAPSLDVARNLREKVLFRMAADSQVAMDLNGQINKVLSGHRLYSFAQKDKELAELQKASSETAAYVDGLVASAQKCLGPKPSCSLSMITQVPSVQLPPLLSDVGGCQVWTDDNQYCLDFRKQGPPDTLMQFLAPMKPGAYNVRATGTIFPLTIPGSGGDTHPISVVAQLVVQAQSPAQEGDWWFNESRRVFDITVPSVNAKPESGIGGSLGVLTCNYVTSQTCNLLGMTVMISPVTPPAKKPADAVAQSGFTVPKIVWPSRRTINQPKQ